MVKRIRFLFFFFFLISCTFLSFKSCCGGLKALPGVHGVSLPCLCAPSVKSWIYISLLEMMTDPLHEEGGGWPAFKESLFGPLYRRAAEDSFDSTSANPRDSPQRLLLPISLAAAAVSVGVEAPRCLSRSSNTTRDDFVVSGAVAATPVNGVHSHRGVVRTIFADTPSSNGSAEPVQSRSGFEEPHKPLDFLFCGPTPIGSCCFQMPSAKKTLSPSTLCRETSMCHEINVSFDALSREETGARSGSARSVVLRRWGESVFGKETPASSVSFLPSSHTQV